MKSNNSKINKLEISLLEENSRVLNNLKKLSTLKSKKEFNENNNIVDIKQTNTNYNNNLYWNENSSLMAMRISKSDDGSIGKSDVGPIGKSDDVVQIGKSDDAVQIGKSDAVQIGKSDDAVQIGKSNDRPIGKSDDEQVGKSDDEQVGKSDDEQVGKSDDTVQIGKSDDTVQIGKSDVGPIGKSDVGPIGKSDDDIYTYNKNKLLTNISSNVCYRGEGEITNDDSTNIELPHYVDKVYTDLTIQLTPIYNGDKSNITLYTSNIEDNKFTVYATKNVKFYWMVYGKYCNINNEIKDLDLIVNNFL